MSTALFANPGQSLLLAVQVVDGYGVLHDGYQAPTVDFVRMPSGTNAGGYPTDMTEINLGIWIHSLTIPAGSTGLGSYLVSCSWPRPDGFFQNELFIINVAFPFGNTSISPV